MDSNELIQTVIVCAIEVYKILGPGTHYYDDESNFLSKLELLNRGSYY